MIMGVFGRLLAPMAFIEQHFYAQNDFEFHELPSSGLTIFPS